MNKLVWIILIMVIPIFNTMGLVSCNDLFVANAVDENFEETKEEVIEEASASLGDLIDETNKSDPLAVADNPTDNQETKAAETAKATTKAQETIKVQETTAVPIKPAESTTAAPTKSTTKPTESTTAAPTKATEQTTTAHVHNWVAQTKTMHHEAEYTTKWVEDKAAWDEQVLVSAAWDEQVLVSAAWDEQVPIIETHLICDCGFDFAANGYNNDQINAHLEADLSNGGSGGCADQFVTVGYNTIHHDAVYNIVHHDAVYNTVHHDATGHNEKVLVKAAYDETVTTGYKCSGCGEIK